jgi:serine/threonine-protein phosphatase 5
MDDAVDKSLADDAEEQSLVLKDEGNRMLLAGKFLDAIRLYSEALEYTPTNAVVLSNRAQAYIKVENYGLAIEDASVAIESDPDYAKAYYRRASAEFALNKFKAARKDFRQVCKLKPKDRDARLKFQECEKVVREEAFSKAITSEKSAPLSDTFDPNTIPLDPASYDGPHPSPEVLLNDMEAEMAIFEPGELPRAFVMVRFCWFVIPFAVGSYFVTTISCFFLARPPWNDFAIKNSFTNAMFPASLFLVNDTSSRCPRSWKFPSHRKNQNQAWSLV